MVVALVATAAAVVIVTRRCAAGRRARQRADADGSPAVCC